MHALQTIAQWDLFGELPSAAPFHLDDVGSASSTAPEPAVWEEVRLPLDELLSHKAAAERIGATWQTIVNLVELGALTLARDAEGTVGVVWRYQTTRDDIIEDWVAANSPLASDEKLHTYSRIFIALSRKRHVDGVPQQAYDYIRSQGGVMGAYELTGAIGGYEHCKEFLLERKRSAGEFIPIRHVTGGALSEPTVTIIDVIARLALDQIAEGTAADPKLMDDHQSLTGFQCRALLEIGNETLFRVIALYILIKLADDAHPFTINRAIQIGHRLDIILGDADVRRRHEIEPLLTAYLIDKTMLSEDSDNMRWSTIYMLYTYHEGVGDWSDLLGTAKARKYFEDFRIALPRRSSRIVHTLFELGRKAGRTGFGRRKNRSDRLVAGFDLVRYTVDVRQNQMRRMHLAYREACAKIRRMKPRDRFLALPYEFHYRETVPTLGDEPAVEQRVLLRLTTRADLLAELADQDGELDHTIRKRAPGGANADPADADEFLLEYVDTVPVRAGEAVRPLWLIDIVRSCFYQNPSYLKPADLRRRRAMITELRLGPAAVERSCIFFGFGLKHRTTDLYRALQRLDRLYLPIENMMMATMFARIATRITSSNGARPSEVMQLQASEERWGQIFDVTNRVDVTYFEAVPKARQDFSVFFIDEDTRLAIDELIDFLCWRYHDGAPLPPIKPACAITGKRLHGEPLPRAPYILRWRNEALDHTEFTICQRLIMHGVGDFLPYDMRHAFATVARAEHMPKDVLMKIMHHQRQAETDHYSDPTAQQKATFFTTFATKRTSVGDLLKSAEDALEDDEAEALDAIGVLGKTPGGQCLNPAPCGDSTACPGCSMNFSNPAYRDEVLALAQHSEMNLKAAQEGGFQRFVVQEQRNLDDILAMLREMDFIEAAHVDADAPTRIVRGHDVH